MRSIIIAAITVMLAGTAEAQDPVYQRPRPPGMPCEHISGGYCFGPAFPAPTPASEQECDCRQMLRAWERRLRIYDDTAAIEAHKAHKLQWSPGPPTLCCPAEIRPQAPRLCGRLLHVDLNTCARIVVFDGWEGEVNALLAYLHREPSREVAGGVYGTQVAPDRPYLK